MVAPGGRYLPLLAVGGLTVLVAVLLFGRGGGGLGSPVRTQAVAALTADDPAPGDNSHPVNQQRAEMIVARVPVLVGMYQRLRSGGAQL